MMEQFLFFLVLVIAVIGWLRPWAYSIKPAKRSPEVTLASLQADRHNRMDQAHKAWEEWWSTLTDAPPPVQKKYIPLKMNLPSATYRLDRANSTYYIDRDSILRLHEAPPHETFKQKVERLTGDKQRF